jgi:CheY-like chemotaxis protein
LLPAAEGAAGSAGDALSNAAEPTDLSLNTVLVVEDEHLLRQAVAKMLRKSGFKVLEAADGSTAIDILRANAGSIDVIFLDISIPGASPLEVVAESEKARADTRVLLTSAYSQEMIANTMRAPQIRGFIRKPFQLGDLLRVLRETLCS